MDQVSINDGETAEVLKDLTNKVAQRSKFKLVLQDDVASIAPFTTETTALMAQKSSGSLVRVAESVIDVCSCLDQFLLRTKAGVEHGLVQTDDGDLSVKSLF